MIQPKSTEHVHLQRPETVLLLHFNDMWRIPIPFWARLWCLGKRFLSTRWFTVDSDSGSMGWHSWVTWAPQHLIFSSAMFKKLHKDDPCKTAIHQSLEKKSVMVDDSPSLLPDHPLPSLGNRSQHPHLCVRSALKSIEICEFFLERNLLSFPRRSKQAMLGLACTGWSFQYHLIFEKNSQLPFLQQARAAETFSWGLRGLIRAESESFMLK